MSDRCPTCGCSAPHMHPAVQHEGEVEICTDEFHLRETPQNLPQYREAVRKKRHEKEWQANEAKGCHCRQPHHLPVWWCPVHGEVTVPMD